MKKRDLWLVLIFLALIVAINVVLVATRQMPWTSHWDSRAFLELHWAGILDWRALGVMVAAAVTVALFSQLYDDNPVFKLAEHLFVGVTVGYGLVITWYQVWITEIIPGLKDPAGEKLQLGLWSIVVPGLLGLMMYSRLSRKISWVSRVPLALLIGFGVGYSIPQTISAYVLKQLEPMMKDLLHDAAGNPGVQWNQIVILLGVMATLVYFFFSVEHKKTVGAISRVGVWFLMVAFGASFGYTVMARLSLLIGRVDFLFREWVPLIGR